jgi:NTP pyrophosphatase (non-canonical NTP hydrolase)
MHCTDFQIQSRAFAQYPGAGTTAGLSYVTLGLCGEAGEVAEKVKKLIRDDGGVMSDERRLAIRDELSDALWYLAQMHTELGLTFDDTARRNLEKLSGRRSRSALHGSGDDR